MKGSKPGGHNEALALGLAKQPEKKEGGQAVKLTRLQDGRSARI